VAGSEGGERREGGKRRAAVTSGGEGGGGEEEGEEEGGEPNPSRHGWIAGGGRRSDRIARVCACVACAKGWACAARVQVVVAVAA